MSLETGQVFAGYKIVRELGAGGMGQVYLAAHPRLPREDALKVLPADLTGDPEFRGRFMREAELAAGLSHPHIVTIHDRGQEDGRFWISMDYVAGTDAGRLLRESHPGGMPLEDVVAIITAVGSALDYAHGRGLLHRDVKPANVFLDSELQPVLADFGLAKMLGEQSLTASGMISGTPTHISPEQTMGKPLDAQSDLYSLAVIGYQLLTARLPFKGEGMMDLLYAHVHTDVPPPTSFNPALPTPVDEVMLRALAKTPANAARFRGFKY